MYFGIITLSTSWGFKMKKIIVLLLFVLLVGCSRQQEEDCLDSFCVDSFEYRIEGTISVLHTNRGTVEFHASLTDEKRQLREVTIDIFSSEWEYIGEVNNTEGLHLMSSSNQLQFEALKPSTDYIAVMNGVIVFDGEFASIGIAYTEFTTDVFSPVVVSRLIDNIRVGSSFVVYDFQLLSNDYYIVSYGVFLYEGELKLDEFTVWGSRDLTSVTKNNQVFADLDSNTTYTLKLDVIYEIETIQNGTTIDEITFTTD
jgi:hypothetical protein